MGLIDPSHVADGCVLRRERAYPVDDAHHRTHLATIRAALCMSPPAIQDRGDSAAGGIVAARPTQKPRDRLQKVGCTPKPPLSRRRIRLVEHLRSSGSVNGGHTRQRGR